MKNLLLLTVLLLLCLHTFGADSEVDIAKLKTFCSVGKQSPVLNGYKEATLLYHKGRGCLTHMWFGGSWRGYVKTVIRVYVDGEVHPSIEMEMGLGHGVGFNDTNAPWGSEKMGRTGRPSGFYNTFKIPFGTSIRVTAQRAKSSPDGAPFWWIVRGTDNLPVTLAGVRLPANARLHLYKLVNYNAKPLEQFDLCNVKGPGALYLVTIAAKVKRNSAHRKNFSYLEGEIRAYLNGASTPTPLSSGLEDYFVGTYYFNRGRYANALAGLTHLDSSNSSFSAYRFHDTDPVFFQNGLRLTCRCGETLNGKTIGNPVKTEYTTYVWLYQW